MAEEKTTDSEKEEKAEQEEETRAAAEEPAKTEPEEEITLEEIPEPEEESPAEEVSTEPVEEASEAEVSAEPPKEETSAETPEEETTTETVAEAPVEEAPVEAAPTEEEPLAEETPSEASKEETATEPVAEAPAEEPAPKKKSNLLYDIIIVVGVVLVLVGALLIFRKYRGDADTKDMYSDLMDSYVTVSDTEDTEDYYGFEWVVDNGSDAYSSQMWYNQISVDFDGLNSINKDVVGWIYQENGSISYPLMYSGDNSKYLRTTFEGTASTAGSIFVSGYNNPDFTDSLTLIYGHNMKNASMFGSLKEYKNDPDFYQDHQYIQIYTEDGMAYRYHIYAFFDAEKNEGYFEQVNFFDPEDPETYITTEEVLEEVTEDDGSITEVTTEIITNEDSTYQIYLNTVASRNTLDTDDKVTANDKTIGLWTCTLSGSKRFLVYAVLVDQHDFNAVAAETDESDLDKLDR